MSAKTFVDSNILIYAYDRAAGAKKVVAEELLESLWMQRTGALSMQVLQEFYFNAIRKIRSPLLKDHAREVVAHYSKWCIRTTPAEIKTAFRIEDEARIGFWDALIVAAAVKSGATRILSEDLSAGQRIAGILIENPFVSQAR
jgi:predicted nucleic acid-binding protein